MILDNNYNYNNSSNYNNNGTPFGVNNMGLNNNFGNYINRNNNSLPNTYQQQSNQFLKCRPVSSKEEAIATQIDLDGSLWVFTDLGNQKIYTKKIRNDGTSEFNVYSYTEEHSTFNNSEYVTKNEFNQVIKELMAAMQIQPQSQKQNTEQNNNLNNNLTQQAPVSF